MAINTDKYTLKVYLVDVVEFESYDETTHKLRYAKLSPGEANRLAYTITDSNKRCYMFDYKTGEQLFSLNKDAYGRIEPPIYMRTKYVTKAYNYPLVNDKMLNDCIRKYNDIIDLAEKEKEGKVIPFPKKQLF